MIALYYKITGPEIKVSKTDKEMPTKQPPIYYDGVYSYDIAIQAWHSSFVPCEDVHPEHINGMRELARTIWRTNNIDPNFTEALSRGIIIDAKTFEELVEVETVYEQRGNFEENEFKSYLVLKETKTKPTPPPTQIIKKGENPNLKPKDEIPEAVRQRSKDIELLEVYSKFLEERGFMDTDWRAEEPYAIDEFLKSDYKIFKNQH